MKNKVLSYDDEDLLAISGIQHFAFCPRQWALIHVEKQWAENLKTVEGKQLHGRVDDPFFNESRNEKKVVRSMPLVSRTLGLYGIADVVEIIEYPHKKQEIRIIEYKRGKPKSDDIDAVQLCGQAMCLEEMLGVQIDFGFFFYGETKHRHKVDFSSMLREKVKELTSKMHDTFVKGITPPAEKKKYCKSCSLVDLCLPILGKKKSSAKNYIGKYLAEVIKELNAE